MNINPWLFVVPLSAILLAFTGVVGAQMAVLAVTLGIFFGTLSLGRRRPGSATSTSSGT